MKNIIKVIVIFCGLIGSTASFAQSCEFCNGANATLTANGTGLTAPTYAWSTGETTQSITVTAGTYTVTVTDQGCTGEATFTVTECDAVVATCAGTDNTSCDTPNGIVGVAATGGCDGSSYTYLWSNGATTQNQTGLSAGTYSVTVTDAAGCTGVCSTTIADDPEDLTITIDCTPNN